MRPRELVIGAILVLGIVILSNLTRFMGQSVSVKCNFSDPDIRSLFRILDGPGEHKATEIADFLKVHKVPIDALNDECETPLHYSIRKKDHGAFFVLYQAYGRPDVNVAHGKRGRETSIYDYALRFGDSTFVLAMRKGGGRISAEKPAQYPAGTTDLMIAATYNPDAGVTKALIVAGEDVNSSNAGGATALILAAGNNPNVEVTRTLLRAGADVNHTDARGATPLYYARYVLGGSPAVAQLIKEAGGHY
jgi:ankyrin repeat protein